MCCKQLSLVFQCLPRTQGIHNRLPNSFTQRDGHEHLNCTWYYLRFLMISAWLMSLVWFLFLASTVRACAADPLDATQERNLAVDHLGRQAAMDDLILRGCVFFGDIGCGSKLERKVNGQQTTCQCEFLLQYHCMTLWHCCVFLCIILLSLVFISLMNQSLDVQMPWPSSAQEEKFQFFRQGFLVKWRYIWDHSTVSVVLGNLHAELSIVRDSQTEDPRTQFVYACLFVVRALRSLRPARTCATKLLRDFNLHLQPSMPRSWSKLRGWNRWVTNRSWFIQSTIVTIVSF